MLPLPVSVESRRVFLRAKRAVATLLGGRQHSVFKGAGLAFEEVRPYQPGDDVRSIDWNVTARMGQPYLKRYVEERELHVLLVVDISPSMHFGTAALSKRSVAIDVAALISLITMHQNDPLGLLLFAHDVEHYVPPRKGQRHVRRVIHDLLTMQPDSQGSRLRKALQFVQQVWRKRGLLFLITDLCYPPTDASLASLSHKHDLVVLQVTDARELTWPAFAGEVWLEDMETQQVLPISLPSSRSSSSPLAQARAHDWQRRSQSLNFDLVPLHTDGHHLRRMVHYLRHRQRSNAKGSR